jgi:hypothetical protein
MTEPGMCTGTLHVGLRADVVEETRNGTEVAQETRAVHVLLAPPSGAVT